MIIHFVKDEKVVDQLIENFLAVNPDDIFFIFDSRTADGYRYIRTKDSNNVFNVNEINLLEKIEDPQVDAILLHGLYPDFLKIVLKIERNVKIGWICWGFGVYSLPLIYENILASETKKIVNKRISKNIVNYLRSNVLFRKLYFFINKTRTNNLQLHHEGVKKITYFISYIKEDFDIYEKFYPNHLQFINCAFSTIDQYVAIDDSTFINTHASNILLGNSNTPENNHVDAMLRLQNQLVENQKVYTILSYGPDEVYKKRVINKGEQYLGNSFVPILGFLERSEYVEMLKTCSVGIFYHFRQQAMGNIIAMLYLGARIYMSSKNPAYSFLKRNGIIVFDLDQDYKVFKSDRLSMNEVLKNREILNKIFSKEKVSEDIKNLTKILKE
ncbi:MAG: TDP-N-acetylfucosamine:lipid II N-acetylfucosaminyltransferase [Kaistella sp.]